MRTSNLVFPFVAVLAMPGLACAAEVAAEESSEKVAPATPSDAGRTVALDAIHVSGSADGDTEGSGEYTTRELSVGKLSGSPRETPQSVSVLTRQRMDDQNVTDLAEAMRYVTGMQANDTTTGVVNIEARGYLVDNYMIDGLNARGGQGMWGASFLDFSFFDRAEVWRGPSGILQGAGNPSGTINLVRKRARREYAVSGALLAGSWDRYRAEADVTGALTADGRLRGRMVAFHDQSQSFVDVEYRQLSGGYGTLEYDLSAATTLSAGVMGQWGDLTVNLGLPMMADGTLLDVPRSTYIGAENSTKDQSSIRTFVELEHALQNGGKMVATASKFRRFTDLNRYMSQSTVDPETGDFTMRANHQVSRQDDLGFDAYVLTPFSLLGREHELVAGVDYREFEGGLPAGANWNFTANINDLQYDYALPSQDVPAIPKTRIRQTGTYAQSRVSLADRWTATLGARLMWWETDDPDEPEIDQKLDAEFVPYAALMFDVTQQHSLYVSYSSIFTPQEERTVDGDILPARDGRQWEAGIKGEYFGGRLNAQLAAYRIDDTNRALTDPDNEDFSIAAGEVRAQGMEAEVTGQITPGWNLTIGYAYTETEFLEAPVDQQGQTFNSTFPKHNFNAWTSYRLPGDLNAWQIGGGLRSASAGSLESGGVRWQGDDYVVASAQLGYRFARLGNLMLTVNNLFDETYYERFGSQSNRQTRFGAPRNFTLAWRGSFGG